ncbi:MAG: ATP synthase F1 subunit delta [Saprospiraceae bacterium]|nr:ATP synthase F1 subunit delta [Saprospiraceae bacterium]
MDLALERNELDAILQDIEYFNEAIKNRDLHLLIKSPIINTTKKLHIFKLLFDGKLSKTRIAFFDVIMKKGMEMFLPEISADFISQYKDYNKISTVIITTATPLNETLLGDIKLKLLASQITMDRLDIVTKIDPNIIGGFMIEVGDKLYDASVVHKLDQLKKEFIGNQYVKSI